MRTLVGGLAMLTVALGAWGCEDQSQSAAGRFRHVVVDRNGPRDPWGKAAGDLTGDGLPDLVVGGRYGGGLVWYENPGWARHTISPDGEFSTDHEVGDVNGDGLNDVVSLTYDEVVWFRNGGWERHKIATAHLHDIEVADLDGDGKLDVVGRGQTAFGDTPPGLDLFLQRDSGWVTVELEAPPGEGLRVADLDADGAPDLVIGGLWYRNPSGGDTAWSAFAFAPEWEWQDAYAATGDLNGDGRLDIVLAPAEVPGLRHRLSWFEAPADRTVPWTEHVIVPDLEASHHFVGVADFNQDGRADVATAAMHQGEPPTEVAVYLQPAGAGEWRKLVLGTRGSHNMRILDVDADGDPDLFGANWQGDHQQVELWINRQCTPDLGCASQAGGEGN